jgi:uncharacterized protein (DUF2252 family)
MAGSAFRFFRGTCHLFYEDLGKHDVFSSHPATWICGDLHLENFGSYKGNNRLVYFDLNDYDEAVLSPATWELARMVTSIFTGFESLQISKGEALRISKLFLKIYSETLQKGKALFIEPETAKGIVKKFLETICERKQKTLLQRYALLKSKTKKPGTLINNAKLFPVAPKESQELKSHLAKWLKTNNQLKYPFKILDVCFRIAGTGSIGVKRYAFLVQNISAPKKYILIDMKQAKPSSLQPYIKTNQPSWSSEAGRVVAIQERMQNVYPALLGTTIFKNDSYVIKELQPTADKIDFLVIKDRYKDIVKVIEDMAILTASAQLRSSGRQGSAIADELIAFGKNTEWQQHVIDYALKYSKQVKKDFLSFSKDYNKGFFSK